MYFIAGVKPVQDDARAGQVVPPLGVAQLCGRIGAVYRADGASVRTQPLHDLREQRVLLVGVALVVGLDAVRRRKVLKDAADVQPGQGGILLPLAQRLAADADFFSQCLLAQPLRPARILDILPQCHTLALFPLFSDMILPQNVVKYQQVKLTKR